MSNNKFDVITKAVDLMEHSFSVTSNRKRYPVKYLQLIKRIQNLSMDIYEYIFDANRLDVIKEKNARLQLQTKAISTCDKLSKFVEMSMKLNLIGTDTVSNWQSKICDVKYMTIAWRERDKKR